VYRNQVAVEAIRTREDCVGRSRQGLCSCRGIVEELDVHQWPAASKRDFGSRQLALAFGTVALAIGAVMLWRNWEEVQHFTRSFIRKR
jgi:hypothetical protein